MHSNLMAYISEFWVQNAEWLCSWCPWVTSSSHYWTQSWGMPSLWKLPAVRSAQLPGETSTKGKGKNLSLPSSLLKAPAKSRQQTWGPEGKVSESCKKNHKQWEIKVMAKGLVKRFSTWSIWDSAQRGEPHHKTMMSFTQQLKMAEFSGIYFSTLNVTASGVRGDKSHTASFPQHLTTILKPKCPQCNRGTCCRGPPGCQRRPESPEFNKGCVHCKTPGSRLLWLQRKAQGTIFLEEGETKCHETVISLGLLQQNLHFSTSAAQP